MENIADIRRRLSLSQAALADMIGLNQSTICRMEAGKLPIDKRTRLALDAVTRDAAP